MLPSPFVATFVGALTLCARAIGAGSDAAPTNRSNFYRVTTLTHAPFVKYSKEKRMYQGFIIDLLKELSLRLNFTYKLKMVKDGHFGSLNEWGNWTGMVGEVVHKEVDFAAAPLTITSKRAQWVKYSQPFLLAGLRILVKIPSYSDSLEDNLFLVFKPFNIGVWILILLAYFFVSILFYLIGRFSPDEWANVSGIKIDWETRHSFNFCNSLFYTFSTLTWQGYRVPPRSHSGRVLTSFWWIFVVFMMVLYIGNMTAYFLYLKPHYKTLPFISFSEMAQQKHVSYGIVKQGSTAIYFRNSVRPLEMSLWKSMMSNPDNFVNSVAEGVSKVRNSKGRYALILEGPMAEYIAGKEPCDLMIVGEKLTEHSYGFICHKDSDICSELDHALLYLREKDIIHQLHRKWFIGSSCLHSLFEEYVFTKETFFDQSSINEVFFSSHMSVHHFGGLMIFLMIGIIISLGLLLVEVFFLKRRAQGGNQLADDERQIQESFDNVS